MEQRYQLYFGRNREKAATRQSLSECVRCCLYQVMRRVLGELFDAGCFLVATSNRPPIDLYKGGINRDSFLPAIALLRSELTTYA